MLMWSCGWNVGAHLMMSPRSPSIASRNISSCAESSFLPPWRAIWTVIVRPSRRSTDRITARAACSW
ncbi:MAG TPA: hypothetical protein VFC53_12465 [Dehalococcoidia bacterium]|nr:hypothetical protein [Dehalococcoidia bacterium]